MLKLILAALVTITVVGCGKTPEEKKEQAMKDLTSYDRNGGVAFEKGFAFEFSAEQKAAKKSLENQNAEELRSIKADLEEAEKNYKRAISSFNGVLKIASKKEDTGVSLLNPQAIREKINVTKERLASVQAKMEKVDAELAKPNRPSPSGTSV